MRKVRKIIAVALLVTLSFGNALAADKNATDKNSAGKKVELLNVSYDPTRELYEEYNALFSKYWLDKTGQEVAIKQSHGGSGKQARAVIDGLRADVVTLALAYDIDAIADKGKLLPANWQEKFPENSSPYSSTIVFLVRKGNPKHIKDWDDIVKSGVKIITPNPKTSGGARWNHIAAYGYALKKFDNDTTKAKEFLKQLYQNVPVFDTGARGATTTFVQRGIGDVLLAWENEAYLAINELGADKFDIVVPSISVLAEPPVAVVDKVAYKNNNLEVAREYLNYLYSEPAQEIIAKKHYRPSNKKIAEKYAKDFPKINLLNIKDFGGWKKVQKEHFDDGGVFDQVTRK